MSKKSTTAPALTLDKTLSPWAQSLNTLWAQWWQDAASQDRNTLKKHARTPSWAKVWIASRWFAEQCLKHPDWLVRIVSEDSKACTGNSYRQRWRKDQHNLSLHPIKNEEQLMRAIRLFRHYEIARIIYRDINRIANTQTICAEISALAEHLLQVALEWHYQNLQASFGTPVDEDGNTQRLGVIGMGKLGGTELNLCSDVDLIFVFPSEGKPDKKKDGITQTMSINNQEFFEKQARAIINTMSAPTEEGVAWKMDMRLRPYGSDGSLVSNHRAMEMYYESQGREWERYALCKARAVAGDKENTMALIERLKPFIYRRYLDFNTLEALRATHETIHMNLEPEQLLSNIKLGNGGIREIEFSVQFFQLVYGGKQTKLHHPSTLKTLQQLLALKHISATQRQQLLDAYCFLRNVEHALQAYENQQTHLLPEPTEQRAVLAVAMGYQSWDEFSLQLNAHREAVHDFFQQLIAPAEVDSGASQWQNYWLNPESIEQTLSEAGEINTQTLVSLLEDFRSSLGFKRLNEQGHKHLNTVMPRLLERLAEHNANDDAMRNCFQVVATILKRSNYLALLAQNPTVLERWVALCVQSPWLSEQIIAQPMLLDELVDTISLYQTLTAESIAQQLQQQMSAFGTNPMIDPSQAQLEALKNFHTTQQLRIAINDLEHLLAPGELAEHLSVLAECLLETIVRLATEEMLERFGAPQGKRGRAPKGDDVYFCVIAYGKLGSAGMNYTSDLDLVFLYDAPPSAHTNGDNSVENSIFYTRLSQRILAYLNASGIYKTDIQLRPSGHTGALVATMESFAQYQQEDAWVWEHQALIPARAVTGSPRLRKKFEEIRRTTLAKERDEAHARKEVLSMRGKMDLALTDKSTDNKHHIKHDPGGLIDIEFIVNYLVLRHAWRHSELLIVRNTDALIERMINNKLIAKKDGVLLQKAYSALSTENNYYILRSRHILPQERIDQYHKQINRIWQSIFGVARLSVADEV